MSTQHAQHFEAVSAVGCAVNSWSPEVFSFYGDGETILRKLANFEMNLPDRRIYAFLIEDGKEAEVRLYERADHGKVTVRDWRGAGATRVREDMSEGILANRGVSCVGEQTKALLAKYIRLEEKGTVPAPANAKAAFGHALRDRGGSYLRATVFLMC